MIKRIIDKDTNNFIRDDFGFDEKTEIGLDVDPSYGHHLPKWNGTEWVEGLTDEAIAEITKPVLQEPTVEDRLASAENTILSMLFMA